jgi:hypothetical protein
MTKSSAVSGHEWKPICRNISLAVLAIIADAEQYFSTDSTMARPTFSGASGLGVGAP